MLSKVVIRLVLKLRYLTKKPKANIVFLSDPSLICYLKIRVKVLLIFQVQKSPLSLEIIESKLICIFALRRNVFSNKSTYGTE